MKNVKILPFVMVSLGAICASTVTLTSCSAETCKLVEKNITGCTCYNGNPKFVLKLDKELTSLTNFGFKTTNIKIYDRFHQEITPASDEIFTFETKQGIDKKTVEISLTINQPKNIFSGCKVFFDFTITRLENKAKQWSKAFHNCSVEYQNNLLIDDNNFITYDQCNTGTIAHYRIAFPLLKKLYRPIPAALKINNIERASLSDDYKLSNFGKNVNEKTSTVFIAFDAERQDKKAFQEGEIIPFYLDLSYEDDTEVENTWYEYIPYLYVKHTETKVKEPEVQTITINKPTEDYYQFFSLTLDFAGDYKINDSTVLNISFSYPRGKDVSMSSFYLTDQYAGGGYKKYYVEFVSKISKDIELELHKLVFNVDFENITDGWKQSVPVMIDLIVKE